MSITFDANDQNLNTSEYVDDIIGYEDENSSLTEAIKRIEQAKLYESLIKHDFFAPGSARQEIQDKVTKEIRSFILERLEILVGIRSAKQTVIATESSVFGEDEISALKEIANKLIQKTRPQPATQTNPQVRQYANTQRDPTLNQARPSEPVINQVKAPAQPYSNTATRPNQPRPKPAAPMAAPEPEKPRPEGGEYRPQAVSKIHPPKAMPSQAEINMRNATEVARRQATQGTSITDQILRLASAHAQQTNKNIVEDLGPK